MKGVLILILALVIGVLGVVMFPILDQAHAGIPGDNVSSPSGVSEEMVNISTGVGEVSSSMVPVIVLILIVMGGIVILGGILRV